MGTFMDILFPSACCGIGGGGYLINVLLVCFDFHFVELSLCLFFVVVKRERGT